MVGHRHSNFVKKNVGMTDRVQVVKNPLSPVEHPGGLGMSCELFELGVEQFVVSNHELRDVMGWLDANRASSRLLPFRINSCHYEKLLPSGSCETLVHDDSDGLKGSD